VGAFVDQVHARAAILLDQFTSAKKLASEHGLVDADVGKPYLEMVQKLYEEELPWAVLMDESDLIVRMQGPSVDRASPILSAVSDAFVDIGKQVGRVARAIIGLSPDDKRGKRDIQLALSGLARGSLVVGVRVVRPSESDKSTLFGDEDPLYRSVREAVRQLAVVTQHVSEEGLDEQVNQSIPDPAVRDALTVAAQRLAPTGRKGITTVELYSPETHGTTHVLNPKVRRALASAIRRPVKSPRRGTYEGTVREIDLDARRFELRRVKGEGVVRCAYASTYDNEALRWLNRRLRVTGKVELGPNGEPRLLLVEEAKRTRERRSKQSTLPLSRRK